MSNCIPCANCLENCDDTFACIDTYINNVINESITNNFCTAVVKCVNDNLDDIEFCPIVYGCLKSLPGYTDTGTIFLTSIDNVLTWIDLTSIGSTIVIESGNCIDVSGTGSSIDPIIFDLNESCFRALFSAGDCLNYNVLTGKFSLDEDCIQDLVALTFVDTTTVNFTYDDLAGTVIADVNISADPNNAIEIHADGLYVDMDPTPVELDYGGVVTWLQDYDFYVSPAGYHINGVPYTSPEAFVTLSPADPLLDRFDVIYVDSDGIVKVLEGVPSLTASQPGLDLGLQLGLGVVFVQAASTQPVGAMEECAYVDGSEWTTTASDASIVVTSPNTPCSGAASIEGTTVTTGDYFKLVRGTSTTLLPDFTIFHFVIRSKGAWGNRKLNIQWYLAGVAQGSPIVFGHNTYNFASNNVVDCQLITINISDFNIPLSQAVDELRFTMSGSSDIGFFIDNICIQNNGSQVFPADNDIHNQYFGPQTPGDYWIRGNGRADGWFTSPQRIGVTDTFYIGTEKFGWGSWADNNGATVVGFLAEGHGNNGSTAIGYQAYANNGTAVGYYASAESNTVAIGGTTTVGSSGSVTIGGTSTSLNGAALGYQATTSGPGAIAIGYSLSSTGWGSIAINGNALHDYSSAYGRGAVTTATHQFMIGGSDAFTDIGFNSLYFGAGETSIWNTDKFWTITGSIGTNVAGNNWTFAGAKGTGSSSTGSKIVFQTSDATVSGTTLQLLSNKVEILKTGGLIFNKYGVNTFAGTPTYTLGVDAVGNVIEFTPGFGSGSVTSFSSGNLSPLFTTSVATATTTPALSFSLTNAAGGTVFGNPSSSTGAPLYTANPVLGRSGVTGSLGFSGTVSGTVTIKPQSSAGTYNFNLPITAGNAGYILTSGGGAASPMTWTDPATLGSGVITVDNALTLSTPSNAQWGGTLLHDTLVTGGVYNTTFTSVRTGTASTVTVFNTSTGAGVYSQTTTGTAIGGTATAGVAGAFIATNGTGILAHASTGIAGIFNVTPATTNTATTMVQFQRQSTGLAGNNIGISLDFAPQTSDGNLWSSGEIITRWTDATSATRTSQWIFKATENTVPQNVLVINGNGSIQFPQYVGGDFAGTPAYALVVDASGNVLVDTLGGGGGGGTLLSADNGLNLSTPTNVQWGGDLLHDTTIDAMSAYGVLFDNNTFFQVNTSADINLYAFDGVDYSWIQLDPTAPAIPMRIETQSASMLTSIVHNESSSVLVLTSSKEISLSTSIRTTINGRFEEDKGANITAANDLTLGLDGNLFITTGNTQINAITTANWQAGSQVVLEFIGTPTLKHNTVGGAGTATLLLSGAVDYTVASGDTILFIYDGTNWHEIARKSTAIGGTGILSANNGLRLSTATNVQWGGPVGFAPPLLFNTFIDSSNLNITIGTGMTTNAGASNAFSIGKDHTINNSTDLNYAFQNSHTLSGNENVAFGRNMIVSGNTNAAFGADGGHGSAANYAFLCGDANFNKAIASFMSGFGNTNWDENGAVFGSDNILGSLAGAGTANLYIASFMAGINNRSVGDTNIVMGDSLVANNTATGGITQFGSSYTVTTANSFNVGYNTNAFEITQNKVRLNNARFEWALGIPVASANNMTLGTDGNVFGISGAVQINTIAVTNWQSASQIVFMFTGAPLLKNNTAGTGAPLILAGGVDYQAAANDVITFVYSGTHWFEVSRKLASGAGITSITADNGLTATSATNVQLGYTTNSGSPLLHDTYINTGAFELLIAGANVTETLNVNNSAGARAITANASGGVGMFASVANGTGVWTTSTSGTGILSQTTTGIAFLGSMNNSTTNSIETVFNLQRLTTGTGANGIGLKMLFEVETSTSGIESNSIISKWVDATHVTRTSQMDFTGINSATTTTIMSAYGSGVVGIGIASGYAATRLDVVDNSLAGASMVKISTTSTAAASNLQKGLQISLSGANTTASQTTFGIEVQNTHSGTTPINIGIYSSASGVSGMGVEGVSTGSSGIGVYGLNSSTGIGVAGGSSSGYGVSASSTTGVALVANTQSTSTNTVIPITILQRTSQGTPADGMGESLDFQLSASNSNIYTSNQLISKWTTANDATRTSTLTFTGTLSTVTVDLLTLAGDGSVKLRPISATAASAITPAEGMIVIVSTTDATFTSIGFWGYSNSAWAKF